MSRLDYIEFKALHNGAVLTRGVGQWQYSEAFSVAIDAVKIMKAVAEKEIERYNKAQESWIGSE